MTTEEIKQSVSMQEVVERYGVRIDRKGFCCCPFHLEKTPSMKIYKDSYHCFGCGASGDVFSFVQSIECCSFKTAFSMLGGTYEHSKTAFSNNIRANKYKRIKAEEEKKEKFQQECKAEIILTWRLIDAAIKGFEPYSDAWCYAINQEPWVIGLWEHMYINNMKVNEINVLRKCREIRRRITSI